MVGTFFLVLKGSSKLMVKVKQHLENSQLFPRMPGGCPAQHRGGYTLITEAIVSSELQPDCRDSDQK